MVRIFPASLTFLYLTNFANASTIIRDTAVEGQPGDNNANSVNIEAQQYIVYCGGGMTGKCLPGGSAKCRCDSFGTFLCTDQDCRRKCGCE